MKPITVLSVTTVLGVLACGPEATSPDPPEMNSVEAAAAGYVRVNLGTLGGSTSNAHAINNAGQVVGSSFTRGNQAQHAFIWQKGVMQDLGTLGGPSSTAYAINAAGQVVGEAQTASGELHAFLWQSGALRDLGTLGGTLSRAFGINNLGQVVGWSTTAAGATRAFIWENGVMRQLPIGTPFSRAFAINNAGQVAGDHRSKDHPAHAYLMTSEGTSDLGTLGGSVSNGLAIGKDGSVAGWARTGSGAIRAFLWLNDADNVRMKNLGTLGGNQSQATAISPLGRVAGTSRVPGGANHVFTWQNGVMSDVGPGQASGINRAGWIVGTLNTASGPRATLWKPR